MKEPLFKNDCSDCIYLGTYKNRYDLYLHKIGVMPVFIARLGDLPQSVISHIGYDRIYGDPFRVAFTVAKEKGLI
jgi:hypothetical protein